MQRISEFDTRLTSGIDPLSNKLLIDPFGKESPLPIELAPLIFKNLASDLPFLALVCKKWTILVDDKIFRETIRPLNANDSQNWKEIRADVGKECPLPRRAYGDMKTGNYLLTFIPEAMNGVPLDDLDIIKKYTDQKIRGKEIIFECAPFIIQDKRNIFIKSHWVLMEKKTVGRKLTCSEQCESAKEFGKSAHMSTIIEFVASIIMEYIKSGNLIFDNLSQGENTCLRTLDMSHVDYVGVCVGSYDVNKIFFNIGYTNSRDQDVGFGVVRRAF